MNDLANRRGSHSSTRIAGFDILRGLCAIGVALRHVTGNLVENHTGFPGSNLSLYTVYIFFVLSGASLFVAYSHRLASERDILNFMANRLLRIVPLYALVLGFYAIYSFFMHGVSIGYIAEAFLNVTLLFGLGNPGASLLVVGGWSLGIEFAFYLMFPILSAVTKTRYWWVFLVVLFVAQRIFIELLFRSHGLSSTGWVLYSQPLSFIGYFFAGCCIGRVALHRFTSRNVAPYLFALAASLIVLVFYQPPTDVASLVGPAGIVLTLVSCGAVYFASFLVSPGAWRRLSTILGDSSYGVYLMHVPVMFVLKERISDLPLFISIPLILGVTIALAIISNRFFEMPIRRRGKLAEDLVTV